MGVSLRRKVAILFAALLALLAVAGLQAALAARSHNRLTAEMSDRLAPAETDVDQVLQSLLDQETGLRGYVITGQLSFLEPFRTGASDSDAAITRLHSETRTYSSIAARLAAVESSVSRWRTQVAGPEIAALGRADLSAAMGVESSGIGKQLFDVLRAAVNELQHAVRDEINAADRKIASSQRRVSLLLALTVAVAVAGLALAAVLLDRWVMRPVRRLSVDVGQVAGGDLDHAIEPTGPPELSAVGADVERMRRRMLRERDSLTESNQSLAGANEELARSNRELAHFADIASHDLSEPLQVVSGFTRLLADDYRGRVSDEADQWIDTILGAVTRMEGMIRGLLDYARAGTVRVEHEPVDLDGVATDVVGDLSVRIREAGAGVDVGPLPTVLGDRRTLGQLLQNLIVNAVKYRAPDRPCVVHVTGWQSGTTVGVDVADNGVGIPAERREDVFGMFTRLHRHDASEGSGIGLAVCKRIVERHGGRIWLDGNRPHGTVVHVELPAA